jgi:hypothetical protein
MSELIKALVAAHKELPPLTRSKTVNTGRYEYSYCPLDEQISLTKGTLAKHGLCIVQALTSIQDGIVPSNKLGLSTTLCHVSGETIKSWIALPDAAQSSGRPQDLGAAVSYYRRYARQAILDQAAEEDSDGDAPGTVKVSDRNADITGPGTLAGKVLVSITNAKTLLELENVVILNGLTAAQQNIVRAAANDKHRKLKEKNNATQSTP